MSQEARQATLQWLNSLGIRDPSNVGIDEWQQVRSLLGRDRPGFGVFMSLLMFERQQAVAQLMNADLSTSAGAVAAAKLQGIVKCVDNIRELVLDIADPSGEGSTSITEVAGVRFDGGPAEHEPVSG